MENMSKRQVRSYRFGYPSFLRGMARLTDVGGNINEYDIALDSRRADYEALASDWQAVGGDILFAINQYKKEHGYKS